MDPKNKYVHTSPFLSDSILMSPKQQIDAGIGEWAYRDKFAPLCDRFFSPQLYQIIQLLFQDGPNNPTFPSVTNYIRYVLNYTQPIDQDDEIILPSAPLGIVDLEQRVFYSHTLPTYLQIPPQLYNIDFPPEIESNRFISRTNDTPKQMRDQLESLFNFAIATNHAPIVSWITRPTRDPDVTWDQRMHHAQEIIDSIEFKDQHLLSNLFSFIGKCKRTTFSNDILFNLFVLHSPLHSQALEQHFADTIFKGDQESLLLELTQTGNLSMIHTLIQSGFKVKPYLKTIFAQDASQMGRLVHRCLFNDDLAQFHFLVELVDSPDLIFQQVSFSQPLRKSKPLSTSPPPSPFSYCSLNPLPSQMSVINSKPNPFEIKGNQSNHSSFPTTTNPFTPSPKQLQSHKQLQSPNELQSPEPQKASAPRFETTWEVSSFSTSHPFGKLEALSAPQTELSVPLSASTIPNPIPNKSSQGNVTSAQASLHSTWPMHENQDTPKALFFPYSTPASSSSNLNNLGYTENPFSSAEMDIVTDVSFLKLSIHYDPPCPDLFHIHRRHSLTVANTDILSPLMLIIHHHAVNILSWVLTACPHVEEILSSNPAGWWKNFESGKSHIRQPLIALEKADKMIGLLFNCRRRVLTGSRLARGKIIQTSPFLELVQELVANEASSPHKPYLCFEKPISSAIFNHLAKFPSYKPSLPPLFTALTEGLRLLDSKFIHILNFALLLPQPWSLSDPISVGQSSACQHHYIFLPIYEPKMIEQWCKHFENNPKSLNNSVTYSPQWVHHSNITEMPIFHSLMCRVGEGISPVATSLQMVLNHPVIGKTANLNTRVNVEYRLIGKEENKNTLISNLSTLAFYVLAEDCLPDPSLQLVFSSYSVPHPLETIIEHYISALHNGTEEELHPVKTANIIFRVHYYQVCHFDSDEDPWDREWNDFDEDDDDYDSDEDDDDGDPDYDEDDDNDEDDDTDEDDENKHANADNSDPDHVDTDNDDAEAVTPSN